MIDEAKKNPALDNTVPEANPATPEPLESAVEEVKKDAKIAPKDYLDSAIVPEGGE